jgi:septum formation protein
VAVLDGQPLGKPGSREAALAQLRAMRGRAVVFHTAVCVLESASGSIQLEDVPTTVRFRDFSDAQAERYVAVARHRARRSGR